MEIIKKIDTTGESFYILVDGKYYKLFDSKEAIMYFLPLLELPWKKFITEYIGDSTQKSFLKNVNFSLLLSYLFEKGTDYWFVKLLIWFRDADIQLNISSKELLRSLLSKSKDQEVNKMIKIILKK